MLHKLKTDRFNKPANSFLPGPAPQLNWIKINLLVVDRTYQREISRRGAFNVRQIAENFDWSKFAPVIVAPLEGGNYAIVDGQHRTTAALLRELEEVPCQIVQADCTKQAAAFAAVNGNITRTLPQQIFHARLAAGEASAVRIRNICAEADVQIIKRNLGISNAAVGQTNAVPAIVKCLDMYGEHTLRVALRCITRTAGGNAGFLKATIITAICKVLDENKHWRDAESLLLKALDKFSIPDTWGHVTDGKVNIFPGTAKNLFAEHLKKFLNRRMPAQIDRKAA